MQLTDIGLHDVVDSVWNQMLGYEIVPTDGPIDFGTQPYLVGCVSITGDYDITLLVEVPEALARNLAATMFAMDESDLSPDEVFDTLGEMANMVGGNVKGLLAGNTQLSLPTVAEGEGFHVRVPGAETLTELAYTVGAWSMQTRLVARTP